MPRAESQAFLRAREFVARYAADCPNRREAPGDIVFMDDDIRGALGSGSMCYEIDYNSFQSFGVHLRKAIGEKLFPADAIRLFDADARIVVRRPNCKACGELYDDHTPEGRCLFAAAYYHDG